ncbi:MAG: MBL fold metallo-hydrolase [Oscillospiraceae bacterium]|nr:MBL fold metallo-hydrolase [Oscillospiraceae bacterium]
MDDMITITILGGRGSIPVSGKQFSLYGGATSSVLIRADGQTVILDAGTGLMHLADYIQNEKIIPIFLTHSHIDHVLGLPLCPLVFSPEYQFDIYAAERDGRDGYAQVSALMAPPLWPVGPNQLPAKICFHHLESVTEHDGWIVESMEGFHPGGVSVFRVTIQGKKIVYLTDCTITEGNRMQWMEFCQDCDLLLCDGQYSDEQWKTCSTFGHNQWTAMARFGRDCRAKQMRILHHDPTHSDQILDQANAQVHEICTVCSLAYEGEEIVL